MNSTNNAPIYVADLYCGAGGATTGFLRACDTLGVDRARVRLVAVNHWDKAIATHEANHPDAVHYLTGVEKVVPHDAVPGGRLDLLMAAPSCVHHSRARGGKPTGDQQRASAWDVYKWLKVDGEEDSE